MLKDPVSNKQHWIMKCVIQLAAAEVDLSEKRFDEFNGGEF